MGRLGSRLRRLLKRFLVAAVVAALALAGADAAAAQSAAPGQVVFASPANGAVVSSPVEIVYVHTPACEVDHPAQGPYGQNMLPPEVVNVATGKNEMELSPGIGRRIVGSPSAVGLDSVFVTAFEYSGASAIPRQGVQRTERIIMGVPDGTYEARFTQFVFCPGTSGVLRFTVGAAPSGGGGPAGGAGGPLPGVITQVPWFFQPQLVPTALRLRPTPADLNANLAQCGGNPDCEFRVRRIWEIDRRVAQLRIELTKEQATAVIGAGGLTGSGLACVVVCPELVTKGAGLLVAGMGAWWGVENAARQRELMSSIAILGREREACANGTGGCGYLGGVAPKSATALVAVPAAVAPRREAATRLPRPPRVRPGRGVPLEAARAVNRLLDAQAAAARGSARATTALSAVEAGFRAGAASQLPALRAKARRELAASARAYRRLAAIRAGIPRILRGTALAAAPRASTVRALHRRLKGGGMPAALRRAAAQAGLPPRALRALVLRAPVVARSPAARLGDRRLVRAERALARAVDGLVPLLD